MQDCMVGVYTAVLRYALEVEKATADETTDTTSGELPFKSTADRQAVSLLPSALSLKNHFKL